ncbi:MAG: YebC/PmpR family DNA-binding transcriptional regulator [Mycoplasmataceae bacterium]|nr:YebC/PmpR family DNA-binding transcriptional regulator [Mycoplasmataceae bacterium]
MPRKHLIASQTNKKQQMQAKLWQKLAREIRAAVKVGGPNIEANPRLKAAVDKALQNNLSRDSINKNINGHNKDEEKLETLEYEAYGPNGIQIIVSALTDNPNRVASNLRGYLNKLNAKIAKQNSVKHFFENKGFIILVKNNDVTLDKIMELTLENKIIDIVENEDSIEVYVEPDDFYNVKDIFNKNDFEIFDAEIKLIANEKINELEEKIETKLQEFIDSCDDDEDIQWVVTNYEEI